MQSGCATALVLNKWDLPGSSTSSTSAPVWRRKLRLRPRVLTASATTGRNVARVLAEAIALGDRAARAHPDAGAQPLPRGPRGDAPAAGARRAIASSCSTWPRSAMRPPRFAVQVNHRRRLTRDYAYFLENRLRARYRLEGVPLVIDFAERGQRRVRADAADRRARGAS